MPATNGFPKALVHQERAGPPSDMVAIHLALAAAREGAAFANRPQLDGLAVKAVEARARLGLASDVSSWDGPHRFTTHLIAQQPQAQSAMIAAT